MEYTIFQLYYWPEQMRIERGGGKEETERDGTQVEWPGMEVRPEGADSTNKFIFCVKLQIGYNDTQIRGLLRKFQHRYSW